MGQITLKLISLFSRFVKADIIKVFSFTAISTLVKMLTGLVSMKIIASLIGPPGVALTGQLSNFTSIVMSLASGGINNGITKYTAEYRNNSDKIQLFLSSAFKITIFCSFVSGIIMILFSASLSRWIMLSTEYKYVFIIFGCTVLFYSINMMLISIINGFKEFTKYVRINIINSIIGLLFTIPLVLFFGLKGALVSAVTYQSIVLFITLWMIRKFEWANFTYFMQSFNIQIGKKYFNYSIMTLATAIATPLSQIFIRGEIISQISSVEAGWWEGMNRISGVYLLIITTSFSVYYFPRFSEIIDRGELRHEIIKAYKVILPILLGGILLIYLFRYTVISILFTKDFIPMTKLFGWQLIGDFFKISSWVLSILMIAKTMTRTFIVTEIIFSITLVILSVILMNANGVIGATQGYFINYILYFVSMIVIFRRLLFDKKNSTKIHF